METTERKQNFINKWTDDKLMLIALKDFEPELNVLLKEHAIEFAMKRNKAPEDVRSQYEDDYGIWINQS